MKKLSTIGLTVMMIAMLLCSCDPSAVNGNKKGAVVNSITLDFPSAYSMSAEASEVSAHFDATQWNVANFDWYYKTSETNSGKNLGVAVDEWTLITTSTDTYVINGTFFAGDSWDFTVIGVVHSEDPNETLTDPTALFTADKVTLVVSSTEDNVVTPGFEPTTALTSGTDSKIELNLTFTPSEAVQTVLGSKTATVEINGISATSTTTSFTDGKIASGKFTATLDACLSNGDVTVVVKQGDNEIVNVTLPKKVYTYNGITTKIEATITGDDLIVDGVSFVPTLPNDPNNPLFGFKALTANSKVEVAANNYYSLLSSIDGKTWTAVPSEGNTYTLENIDDMIYFKAANNNSSHTFKASSLFAGGTGSLEVFGNIMYLIDPTGIRTTVQEGAFWELFMGNTSLENASELLLPATILDEQCYCEMFSGCTSLETAPDLPATTLAKGCYKKMFFGCTSLTTAPDLPATTLSTECYSSMFDGCTSLETAPDLPATTLVDDCYCAMFKDCSSLNSIKVSFLAWGSKNETLGWVSNVSGSGTFTCPSTLCTQETATHTSKTVPSGWTVSNNI